MSAHDRIACPHTCHSSLVARDPIRSTNSSLPAGVNFAVSGELHLGGEPSAVGLDQTGESVEVLLHVRGMLGEAALDDVVLAVGHSLDRGAEPTSAWTDLAPLGEARATVDRLE